MVVRLGRLVARMGAAALGLFGASGLVYGGLFAHDLAAALGPGLFLLAIAAALWWSAGRTAPSGASDPPAYFWGIVARVFGTLFVIGAVVNGSLAYVFQGGRSAVASALVPWGILGAVLWTYALWSASKARALRREYPTLLDGRGGELASVLTMPLEGPVGPESKSVADRLVADSLRVVRGLFDLAWQRTRRATIVFTVLAVGIVSMAIVQTVVAGIDWLPFEVVVIAVWTGLILYAPIFLRRFEEAGRELDGGRIPELALLRWNPIRELADGVRRRVRRAISAEIAPEPSSLEKSLLILRLGAALESVARRTSTALFLDLFVLGSAVSLAGTYLALELLGGAALLRRYFELPWIVAGAVALLAFVWLYGMQREIDPATRELASLEREEIELERTFWSRF